MVDVPPADDAESRDGLANALVGRFPARLGRYSLLGSRPSGPGRRAFLARGPAGDHAELCELVVLFPEEAAPGESPAGAAFASRVKHRLVVPVLEVGHIHGRAFLVEGLVRGANLAVVAQRLGLPLAVEEAVFFLVELLEGLEAIHGPAAEGRQPIPAAHGGVEPSTLWVTWEGEVRLTGLGLAPRRDLTALGYQAPEQARGQAPDARCDVYAAGVLLFELLTGRPFFAGLAEEAKRAAVQRGGHVPAGWEQLDDDLQRLFVLALHAESRRRYATAGLFRDDLRALLASRGLPADGASLRARIQAALAAERAAEEELLARLEVEEVRPAGPSDEAADFETMGTREVTTSPGTTDQGAAQVPSDITFEDQTAPGAPDLVSYGELEVGKDLNTDPGSSPFGSSEHGVPEPSTVEVSPLPQHSTSPDDAPVVGGVAADTDSEPGPDAPELRTAPTSVIDFAPRTDSVPSLEPISGPSLADDDEPPSSPEVAIYDEPTAEMAAAFEADIATELVERRRAHPPAVEEVGDEVTSPSPAWARPALYLIAALGLLAVILWFATSVGGSRSVEGSPSSSQAAADPSAASSSPPEVAAPKAGEAPSVAALADAGTAAPPAPTGAPSVVDAGGPPAGVVIDAGAEAPSPKPSGRVERERSRSTSKERRRRARRPARPEPPPPSFGMLDEQIDYVRRYCRHLRCGRSLVKEGGGWAAMKPAVLRRYQARLDRCVVQCRR